ncbi:CHC2 zinc finger domain-containing protein [Duganella sp. P38]|uniref:CHC2 zinc finger domain-containing protein n=1 Tax=Duganella sp. P38 TaxID=3423949 RepID=UPI003D79E3B0
MVRDVDRSSIDEILQTARPSSVAEALGIAVVRRGANFRCLCPFHDDSDPSLVLYDNWDSRPPHHHCFVCGADGDVFDMVRHVRNCSFGDAAEWLRSAFGLPQSKRPRRSNGRATWDGSKQSAFEFASALYLKNNDADQLATWLRSRNLSSEIAAQAGLSYAIAQTLTNAVHPSNAEAGQMRIETAMLEEIGLVRRVKSASRPDQLFSSDQPRLRDFFFDSRIIFPIHSLEGKVIGFAGRAASEVKKDVPKYLYSPGFAKGAVLYRGNIALALLQERKRKEIFVCEGLVDALRLESLGYPAVSILGAQASKEQIEQLRRIADAAAPVGDLIIHIFLDRDKAGLKGSSKLAIALAEEGFDADFIWPNKLKLDALGVTTGEDKDPDSLISALDTAWNEEFIRDSSHPTALPVVAVKIGNQHSVDDILSDDYWKNISLGVRYRSAMGLARSASEANFLLNAGQQFGKAYESGWYLDILSLRNSNAKLPDALKEVYGEEFIADEASRLNVARILAKSGADRGEVPTDEAAWRRLEAGATAFNVGLRERLQEPTFEPLEPFDAVFVARDFEKQNPRLKAMPCPEDLVLQQYMLSETLTERFDVLNEEDCYSLSIPAVRFYRGKGVTRTTAENGKAGVTSQTLSFAYQIDMDVLEGRSTASNQGMFRPYIECWRDFITNLRRTANGFEEVYAIRLDLKRYYDRLYQSVVKSALQSPLNEAIDRLTRIERIDEFAPSFSKNRHNLAGAVVDWFCEQSFGFQYYHPDTGRITKSEEQIGIPQGPILSAWLATVALFPLDSELRKVLSKINSEDGLTRAGYARYVDDIFLIADSPQILEELRTAVEDACTRLRLEAIPKGELAPKMTPEEFNALLTEGKALIGSGPTPEIGLLSLGDGEAGFETWSDPVQRTSALVLLSDRRLYEADVEDIKAQIFTALNAHDLRPAEISKAARWIWYAAAKLEPLAVQEVWASYWTMWREVTERLAPKMKVDLCPWLDPSLYALDGLEQLLRSAYVYDRNLSLAAETSRKTIIGALSKLTMLSGFFTEFVTPHVEAPADAGKGIRQLRRMFVQRAVCVRWIARQMHRGVAISALSEELYSQLGLTSNELSASLTRAWLTDADGATSTLEISANVGNRLDYSSPLRPLFLWLHEAIVLLGREWNDEQDPLENIRGKLIAPLTASAVAGNSHFFRLLNLWKPELSEHEIVMLELRLDALAALVAVCRVDALIHCLKRRLHLLGDLGVPLPALPGIPLSHLVLKNPDGIDEVHLKSISQIFIKSQLPPDIDYRVATREICEPVPANWNELSVPIANTGLAGRKSAWESVARKVRNRQPTKTTSFGHKELRWAADCFDGLARINYDLEHEVDGSDKIAPMEFVPAWPYICASDWAEDSSNVDPTFGLFGPVVPRAHLAKFAFARDGKGRLRAHEVPLADARLWRIGYAVTDALGMIDELERFQALEQQGQSLNINTAQYVLSRLLGRLRGEGQPAAPGLPHPERPHLTGSTNRAILLLRSFPSTGNCAEEVQFLLSVEAETVAMRLQNDGYSDGSRSGVSGAMLSKLAPAVFARLNARQLEALPELAPTESVYGVERRVVAAWRLFDKRLALLESVLPQEVPPASKYAWSALRRSVRITALSAWIRALVFEIYLAGDASPAAEVEVPIEWQIDDPVLVIENEDVNIGALFREALTPKGRLASTAKITPLGWLVLFNSQLNLYGASDAMPMVAVQDSERFKASMTELAQQLGKACPDSELDDDKWPFDAHLCIETIVDEATFESAMTLLANIQNILGYRVRNCKSHTWGLPPQAKWFTDEGGRQWSLSRGLIDQVGRDRHVEIDEADANKRVWTETTNRDGKLIGVSVLGETFAKTAGMQGGVSAFPLVPPTVVQEPVDAVKPISAGEPNEVPEMVNPGEVSPREDDLAGLTKSAKSHTDTNKSGEDATRSAGETNRKESEDDPVTEEDTPEESFRKFRNLQEQEWRGRRREKILDM